MLTYVYLGAFSLFAFGLLTFVYIYLNWFYAYLEPYFVHIPLKDFTFIILNVGFAR